MFKHNKGRGRRRVFEDRNWRPDVEVRVLLEAAAAINLAVPIQDGTTFYNPTCRGDLRNFIRRRQRQPLGPELGWQLRTTGWRGVPFWSASVSIHDKLVLRTVT